MDRIVILYITITVYYHHVLRQAIYNYTASN